jgi:hypothetical protein
VGQRGTLRGVLSTGGERLGVVCDVQSLAALVVECSDRAFLDEDPMDRSTVTVQVEASRRPFDTNGWTRLSRDSWHRRGRIVIEDVCTSGLDMHVLIDSGVPCFTFRRRPPVRTRAAAALLPARARLLTRAVLVQFPALWWAATRDRAPLHAPSLSFGTATPLLVGASGVGKTTLILSETSRGGLATGDNVSVGDGVALWGLIEPARVEGGAGRAMPHGRRETHLDNRVECLIPDRLVVLRRGPRLQRRPIDPSQAARELVASTYMAGELRRFWQLVAMLAMGTGAGPPHPPVMAVAAAFAERLPCIEVELPKVAGIPAADLISAGAVA